MTDKLVRKHIPDLFLFQNDNNHKLFDKNTCQK